MMCEVNSWSDHEIEDLERFVGLVDAVDQIEHLQEKSIMKAYSRKNAIVSRQRMSRAF